MNTISITRHTFTVKAPNRAKFGASAPNDGYINSWNEEIPEPETAEEWDAMDEWLDTEYLQAKQDYAEHIGVPYHL